MVALVAGPLMSQFGERVKALREARGISSYRLAQLVGVSRQSLWQLERGDTEPTWHTAVKIALALGVALDDLRTPDIALPAAEAPKPRGRPRKSQEEPRPTRRGKK